MNVAAACEIVLDALPSTRPAPAFNEDGWEIITDFSPYEKLTEILQSPEIKTAVTEHGAFLAGGMFKDLLYDNDPKDIDIFFPDDDSFLKTKKTFEDSGEWSEAYSNDNCVGFTEYFSTQQVELVRRRFGSAKQVVESFDVIVAQCILYWREDHYELILHPFFRSSVKNKILRFADLDKLGPSPLERVQRYYKYGYICNDEDFQKALAQACDENNCSQRPKVSFKEVADYYKKWVNLQTDEQGSITNRHEVIHDVFHNIVHVFAVSGNKEDLKKAVFSRVQTALNDFLPKGASYVERGIDLHLIEDFVAALAPFYSLPEKTKIRILVLLGSGSLVKDSGVWPTVTMFTKLLHSMRHWVADDVVFFIDEIFALDTPVLDYNEWKTFINSELFFPNPMIVVIAAGMAKPTNGTSTQVKSERLFGEHYFTGESYLTADFF